MDNKGRISNLAEEKYQVLFGVRKATFNAMLAVLESAYGEMRKKGGRRRKLSVLDMLIIYLGYYRDYRTMDNIAFDYGVHKQRISEAVGWVEQALVKDGTFALPSKRELQKAGAEIFARTRLLLGTEAMDRLAASRVAVIGVGGVGSYAVEALARGGVGSLLLVDHDRVDVTNINRQLQADNSVIGLYKTKLMGARAKSINPLIDVRTLETFCLPENIGEVLSGKFDYIIDAVDTVSAKLAIAVYCHERGIPLISCMGAANKIEPTRFEVADIADTSVCPLCRVMRRELKKRGIKSLKVVYSREEPIKPLAQEAAYPKRQIPGSVSFVPPVAGMIAAGEAIKGIALRV